MVVSPVMGWEVPLKETMPRKVFGPVESAGGRIEYERARGWPSVNGPHLILPLAGSYVPSKLAWPKTQPAGGSSSTAHALMPAVGLASRRTVNEMPGV